MSMSIVHEHRVVNYYLILIFKFLFAACPEPVQAPHPLHTRQLSLGLTFRRIANVSKLRKLRELCSARVWIVLGSLDGSIQT